MKGNGFPGWTAEERVRNEAAQAEALRQRQAAAAASAASAAGTADAIMGQMRTEIAALEERVTEHICEIARATAGGIDMVVDGINEREDNVLAKIRALQDRVASFFIDRDGDLECGRKRPRKVQVMPIL
jgi:hypothetical protein